MALVLDTAALTAYERGDRKVARAITYAQRNREPVVTSSACVAEVWRGGGSQQVRLEGLLEGTRELGFGPKTSRHVGVLRAVTGSDVADAHLALLAGDGDVILTNDLDDIQRLVRATKAQALVEPC
jgi:predicted nucleic acid-binding protein